MRRVNWPNSLIALALVLAFAGSAWADDSYFAGAADPQIATAVAPLSQEVIPDPTTAAGENAIYGPQTTDESLSGGCTACCCPLWTVRAGAIFLRRDSQDNVVLTNGATPITVGGLSFNNYQAGPMVTLFRHGVLKSPYDFEFTYFGIPSFSNTAASAGATTFFTTPTINFAPRTVTATYSSNFHSTELNLRRSWSDRLTVLGGFRWIEMRDDLAANLSGASDTINVNNHLYGYQMGADVVIFRRGAFTIDGFGKGGIYANVADQTTTIAGVGGAVPSSGAGSTRTAFVGELSLNGMYTINDRWSIRSGYQALWLDGVALAPDQIASSNVVTGVSTLDMHGHPIYHGMTLTAQMIW
ncbi:MAG TPA: BBP7 family outer membrane beta-barrel protein [Pirellulaceae bacterium]